MKKITCIFLILLICIKLSSINAETLIECVLRKEEKLQSDYQSCDQKRAICAAQAMLGICAIITTVFIPTCLDDCTDDWTACRSTALQTWSNTVCPTE